MKSNMLSRDYVMFENEGRHYTRYEHSAISHLSQFVHEEWRLLGCYAVWLL
jgi:hypothetical protein